MKTKEIGIVLFLGMLASCQTFQINPGSERIRVFETEPKNCIFVGEISSIQEDVIEGKAASDPEMSLATRVDLRNKAHSLGGNVLIFMKGGKDKKSTYSTLPDAPKKASDAPSKVVEEEKVEKKVATTFLATTFRCPASIVNQ
ncbi:MAG: DUF4156 domain-containing protein [Bdellovibrio sp.]|nr:DUF4156 domain-containing protein [Bdellovibrio sp.]